MTPTGKTLKTRMLRGFSRIRPRPQDFVAAETLVAAELFYASTLRKAAEARYDAAYDAAVAAGVLKEDPDYSQGDTVLTHFVPGSSFIVAVRRDADGAMIDAEALQQALVASVGREAANEFLQGVSKPRKGKTCVLISVTE